jgi:hypothetical protein
MRVVAHSPSAQKGVIFMRLTRLSLIGALVIVLAASPMATAASQATLANPGAVQLAASSGDWRCFFGPGIQVWEDANKGGRSWIICGLRNLDNLQDYAENLTNDRWNDRITSYETFNSSAGIGVGWNVWELCNEWFHNGNCLLIPGSVYENDLSATYDNQTSSIQNIGRT